MTMTKMVVMNGQSLKRDETNLMADRMKVMPMRSMMRRGLVQGQQYSLLSPIKRSIYVSLIIMMSDYDLCYLGHID